MQACIRACFPLPDGSCTHAIHMVVPRRQRNSTEYSHPLQQQDSVSLKGTQNLRRKIETEGGNEKARMSNPSFSSCSRAVIHGEAGTGSGLGRASSTAV